MSTLTNIKLDPRIVAYKTFFDHGWAREISDLVHGTKFHDPIVSLCVNWKSIANSHVMPWLMVQSLKGFWEGFVQSQASGSEEAVRHLARHDSAGTRRPPRTAAR